MRSLALYVVRISRSNQHVTAAGLLVVGASEVHEEVHLLMLCSYAVSNLLRCQAYRLDGASHILTDVCFTHVMHVTP